MQVGLWDIMSELQNVTYFEVVAPPISSGIFMPFLSISLATYIISSKDGVISPDNPMMSVRGEISMLNNN